MYFYNKISIPLGVFENTRIRISQVRGRNWDLGLGIKSPEAVTFLENI